MKILTSGDSHGYGLFGIVEGFPSHFKVDTLKIDEILKARQIVYGRGARMKIESDHVEILSGLWEGETTGAPLTFFIKNRSTQAPNSKNVVPRPGHADFGGMLKYEFDDTRMVAERASARRTAMDVAIGEFFKEALEELNIKAWGYTVAVGKIETTLEAFQPLSVEEHPLLCPDENMENEMMKEIDFARKEGYTLGGKVRVVLSGLPIGIGTFNSYQERFASQISKALFDIPSVKGVEFGDIHESYKMKGTEVMDEIRLHGEKLTNHAGGIEGGMSNGQMINVDVLIKPVPTQKRGIKTVDLKNGKETLNSYVRSDTCVVGAVSIIACAKLSTIVFAELMNEFSGSTFQELKKRFEKYRKRVMIDD